MREERSSVDWPARTFLTCGTYDKRGQHGCDDTDGGFENLHFFCRPVAAPALPLKAPVRRAQRDRSCKEQDDGFRNMERSRAARVFAVSTFLPP
jgi:hypothetical protein